MRRLPLKALIADIGAQRGLADAQASGVRLPPQRKEGLRQWLILIAGGAKAGDHPPWNDRHGRVVALVPAEAVTLANLGQARKPVSGPAPDISRRHRRAIKGFVDLVAGRHEVYQVQEARHDGLAVMVQQAIELGPMGQGGKGRMQVRLGITVEHPFAWEAGPLSKETCGPEWTSGGRGD
jgi:hypothetical protein